MVKVKICGITSVEDALMAAEAGADALGFNFYPKSPRYIPPRQAKEIIQSLPPFIIKVGVFVNAGREEIQKILDETGIDLLQFHGDEKPKDCEGFKNKVIKTFRINQDMKEVRSYSDLAGILLDSPHEGSYGGTGKTFDWSGADNFKAFGKPLILSGGLDVDNVVEAVEKVRPYAVDACSRLEITLGKKDRKKLYDFVKKVKIK